MALISGVADLEILGDAPVKDKAYRRYAAGVDKALLLFETALEEWADYISFLNRLLKVRYKRNTTLIPYFTSRRTNILDRVCKLDRRPALLFPPRLPSRNVYHNA